MPGAEAIMQALKAGELDALFARLYGRGAVLHVRSRYAAGVREYLTRFGPNDDLHIFSAPA